MSSPGASPKRELRLPALLMFAAGSLLLAVAVASGSAVPVFAALPLLMAPVAAFAATPTEGARADLAMQVEGSGADVIVRGSLIPRPPLRAERLSVRFFRPPSLFEVAPPKLVRTADRIEFELAWRAPFPFLATLSRPEVVWRDTLGLVETPVEMDAPALKIERFPPEASRLGTVKLAHTTPQPGEIRSRHTGASGDFFAVRAAAPTDTPRQINWRATARSGRLLANDYYLERTGDLVLLLDLRPSSLGPERDATLLSIACAGALGIASGFLGEKGRVGLGLFDEFLTAVPLGAGRLQRYRIAQALQKAKLAETPGPSERLAVSMRRYFPPGVTTILLSPLADEESLIVVTHLRRRGYPTIVLSPSPLPLLVPPSGPASADDQVAARLLRLVRRRRIGAAWREVPVIDWDDYWSLGPFVRYLSTPPRPARG